MTSLEKGDHPTEHLRDALRAQISDSMPKLDGMWSDLMTNTLEEINWQEIAEHFLEGVEETE